MSARDRVKALAGWLVAGALYFLAVKPLMGLPTLPLFLFKMGWAVSGFLLTWGMGSLYAIPWLVRRGHTSQAVAAITASIVFAVLWLLLFRQIAILAFGSTTVLFSPSGIPFVFLNHAFLLMAWSGAHFALESWRIVRERERLLAEAALMAKEAHLEMLRYQVNPHFLFNALTSIRGLISEAPDVARRMVTELGSFLRATLDERIAATTSLAAELAVMERYLMIERVRFEERLSTTIECDDSVRDLVVPSFILHPLVENAIRHGRPTAAGAIVLRITAKPSADGVVLEVANRGSLTESSGNGSGHSIGLRNVQERVAAIAPAGSRFDLAEADGWVCARITFATAAD